MEEENNKYDTDEELLARNMYQAYGNTTDFKNYQGHPMPTWEELPEKIKEAWIAAGKKAKHIIMSIFIQKVTYRLFDGLFS